MERFAGTPNLRTHCHVAAQKWVPLSVRFIAARDDLGILKSVLGHLKSAIGKTDGLEIDRCPMPDARFQDFRVGHPLVAATVPL
jgi:hypothetical protein